MLAAGDNGRLYFMAKAGSIALNVDAAGKAPEVVVAFDGSPHLLFRGLPNFHVHDGGV